MQDVWYPKVQQSYGVPLDTRHTYTKSDWQMLTAAIASDTSTRDMFIGNLYKYLTDGGNNHPLSDWYETVNGVDETTPVFENRAVVGGHMALVSIVTFPPAEEVVLISACSCLFLLQTRQTRALIHLLLFCRHRPPPPPPRPPRLHKRLRRQLGQE
jgi:hypothetical protein